MPRFATNSNPLSEIEVSLSLREMKAGPISICKESFSAKKCSPPTNNSPANPVPLLSSPLKEIKSASNPPKSRTLDSSLK